MVAKRREFNYSGDGTERARRRRRFRRGRAQLAGRRFHLPVLQPPKSARARRHRPNMCVFVRANAR